MIIHVIIPAYNEAGRIGETLDQIHRYSARGPNKLVVSVVDDGSTDPTPSIVTHYRDNIWNEVRLLRLPRNQGKGAAVRYGMLHLSPDCQWALLSDADLSSPIEEVERLLRYRMDAGIIIGSRALDPSLITINQPLTRRIMGKVFNLLIRVIVFSGYHDTQCGFKLFSPHIAREVFSKVRTNGFAYDVEAIGIALKRGYRVLEVPVRWNHVDQSRVHIISAPVKMFREVMKIRFQLGRVRPASPPFVDVYRRRREFQEIP